MRRLILVSCLVILTALSCFAQSPQEKPRVALFISEQNIEGPQIEWWFSEIDLSAVEATVAQSLIALGYQVVDPVVVNKIIKRKPAFRKVELSQEEFIDLGKETSTDYIIVGKAIASSGAQIQSSNMVSCFANITAKLIRVSDAKVVGYLTASNSAAHLDAISGGREALVKAANELAIKVVDSLSKE